MSNYPRGHRQGCGLLLLSALQEHFRTVYHQETNDLFAWKSSLRLRLSANSASNKPALGSIEAYEDTPHSNKRCALAPFGNSASGAGKSCRNVCRNHVP